MEARRRALDVVGIVADVLGVAFAGAIGLASGIVLTFTHRQFAPWGLVLGLVLVIALLAGFRLAFGGRMHAAAAAIGVVVAAAILALPGAGGSVLVVDDPLGYVWALGPAVVAAVVLAWPRARPPRPVQAPESRDSRP